MMTEETLFPCDMCGMLCPPPAGEPPEVSAQRGSRCHLCDHRLYEQRLWAATQPWAPWAIAADEAYKARLAQWCKEWMAGQGGRIIKPLTQQTPLRRCVYVVQLVGRVNTFKIGQTTTGRTRLSQLRQEYGALREILMIPYDRPRILEQQLHRRFTRYRLYENGHASELFWFQTKAAQRVFERFLREYPTCQYEAVVWQTGRALPERIDTFKQPALL